MAPRLARGAIFLFARLLAAFHTRQSRGSPSPAMRMRLRSSCLFLPDVGMKRCGLIFQHRTDDVSCALAARKHGAAGQVEGGIFGMVAGDAAQPCLAEAIDQAADAGPIDGARTHRAGLG